MILDQINEILNRAAIGTGLLVILFVLAFHFWGKNTDQAKK